MKITKIQAKNFRLLRNTSLDIKDNLSLLIGKNNSGKTSLISLAEKFFTNTKFNLDDFSLVTREKILEINDATTESDLAIQMILDIEYGEDDDLSGLSDFILDLDESVNTVKILFECAINKKHLLKDTSERAEKAKYIAKNLQDYLETNIYAFQNESDLDWGAGRKLIKKEFASIKKIITFQVIHAKRNVSSSEESTRDRFALSTLTTKFYKHKDVGEASIFDDINSKMVVLDQELNDEYQKAFGPFLENAKKFLQLKNLKVLSNIQSNELIAKSSQVVYGDDEHTLPEHLNGLGFMNVLYLLLEMELNKERFLKENTPLNLLFIEEPEAHTHPQMQYVFAKKIKELLAEVGQLQTLITTHSAHIVSQCDFKDVRYLVRTEEQNVEVKNFYEELQKKYISEPDNFKFLVQYLTLQSSELFFSDKIILIEGTTERILLPYFINLIDEENRSDPEYSELSAQCVSILEVGANSRAFGHFLEFLGIKTLVITDFDSVERRTTIKADNSKTTSYVKCRVDNATHTSNYSIKFYCSAPDNEDEQYPAWFEKLKNNEPLTNNESMKIAYQVRENEYHSRSFEDAFIHLNREQLCLYKQDLSGLKGADRLCDASVDAYDLAMDGVEKKSEFASSLLYLALTNDDCKWSVPKYLKDALLWLAK